MGNTLDGTAAKAASPTCAINYPLGEMECIAMTDDTERKPNDGLFVHIPQYLHYPIPPLNMLEWSTQQDPSSWEPEQPIIKTLPHITRQKGWKQSTDKNPTGKHPADHAQDVIKSVNAMAFEAGALTGRNTILEERNAMLLEALKGLYDATLGVYDLVGCDSKDKAKRAIEMCGGGE